ncbi:hypothetical protein HW555_008119, partial [Spodoptera exigua]
RFYARKFSLCLKFVSDSLLYCCCCYSLEQASTQMINVLQSWITPTQLSPGSTICSECFDLLQNRVNTMSEGSAMPLPALGHRRICFPRVNSILRAPRTYPVRHDRQERNILMRLVPPHLVSRMERVCAACWRSATREVQRQQQHDSNRPTVAHAVSIDDFNIPAPPPLPPSRPVAVQLAAPKITSSLYRRAANTSGHCIFVNCFENERLLVPCATKDLLLYHYKFYVPSGARICRHHLDHGSWNELTSQLRDFTGIQFDNIMTMMQRAANNRTNIRMMPPYLCHYWLGFNADQFYDLLNSIPNLAEQVPNASIALCIYLVKIGTVVLMHQDDVPPLRWPMGIITESFPGRDGTTRVAMVKTCSGSFKRPVVKLCPLPSQ